MADQRDTGISWTDETWNPVVGCSIISPACTNCYAMAAAHGIQAKNAGSRRKAMETGAKVPPETHYLGTTKVVNGKPVWTGKLALAPDHIVTAPLRWKRPRRVFVNSMSDLFHEDMPEEWIDNVFAIMALSPQHTFQILTKRPERMREYLQPTGYDRVGQIACQLMGPIVSHDDSPMADEIWDLMERARERNPTKPLYQRWPLPNVWLGVTAEDQARADERIPHLLTTPAAVRFVSAEPLLGPIDFHSALCRETGSCPTCPRCLGGLDWVIVGGESGPSARPTHPDWVRSIRDQCAAADVAFHFKQWGEWRPHRPVSGGDLGGDVRAGRVQIVHPSGRSPVEVSDATGGRSTEPGSRYMIRLGKRTNGRTLDGQIHDAFPEPR